MADFEFAILGAGAMGSIIGAHLARAGHAVAMLARGERARQLEGRGLAIRGLAEFSTPVRTLRDPAALESAATLIVATKTPGTAQALEPLRRAELGVALSVQNGPLKNEILVQAFGRERVLGALAGTSGELLADGTVLFTRNVNIMIGELGGGDSERAQALARTIDQSGVRAAATAEIVSLEWSKFCGWVGLTSLSVTTRALTWKLLTDPDSALILARLVREMGEDQRRVGIGQELPGERARRHGERREAHPAAELRPLERDDLRSGRGADARLIDGARQRLRALAVPAAELADHDIHVACEEHRAVGEQLAAGVRERAEHALAAEGLHEDLVLQRPILDRQGDAELGPAQRLERLGGARRLGRDDERAGALEGRRIAERAHRRAELGEPPDRESALLELTRALAARQHRDRMPGARQMGPDDRPHRAGAENCELEIGHGGVRATAPRRCPA